MKKVSVIIPVTRPRLAQKAKESVLNQKDKSFSLELILFPAKGITPGKARNQGAEKAKGEILLFLDDDCQVGESWLKENLKALKDHEVGAVGGMILGKSKKYFARCLDFANFSLSQIPLGEERVVSSTSLGVRREIFEAIGGFDEVLEIKEDTDLCYRLIQRGYKCVYQPKIKVFHDHGRTTLKKFLVYQYLNGRKSGLAVENRYPDLAFSQKLGKINEILKRIQHPFFYFLFLIPLALVGTIYTLILNFPYHRDVFLYTPFIFLGKLVCQIGIFKWLFEEK